MAEIKQILVPDIGNYKDVSIIEVMVKAGDTVNAEDNLLTLETDKAAMEVPSPFAGVIKEMKVKVGDKVSQGSVILTLECGDASEIPPSPPFAKGGAVAAPAILPLTPAIQAPAPATPATPPFDKGGLGGISAPANKAHASPAIRRFARELGVDVSLVKGSGEKGRVTKDDVQNFVKAAIAQPRGGIGGGLQVLEMPVFDFAKFGAIETKPLSRIKKISGANLHRNWVTIPHVTQFDEADISEMEAFRKQLNEEYAKQSIKITPLAFLLKAAVAALQKYPEFNASLDAGGENL
ncbi:MAG: branched-chain alpha-keto acid dehydrogenase subunit E2, partial [Gallionella sp.]